MRITDRLDRALEGGLRISHALKGPHGVLLAMRDAMSGQPGATAYDSPVVGGHTTVLDDEGIPMPAVSDLTGEAGCDWADGLDIAVTEHRALIRHLTTAANALEAALPIVDSWQKRTANERERQETERANEPGCEFHARVGRWVAPHVLSSTVAGALDTPVRACRDCYERIRVTGARPTDPELHYHATHDKWPRLRAAS